MKPIDTGWHLRLEVLKRDAAEKILKPFQTHGWTTAIELEVQAGEYVIIKAERNGTAYRLALLYSSATSNAVYKSLDGSVDYTFFNGEPYRLESYAYGLSKPPMPVRDFPAVLIELNRATSQGKLAADDTSEAEDLDGELDDGSRYFLSENPAEAIWLRLRQFQSVALSEKMIRDRAKRSGAEVDEASIRTKAEGVAFALRNATDYYRGGDARNISQRVLNLYYGTMGFAFAEMLALPDGPRTLAEIEDSTKQGHGLYTLDGLTGGLEDLVVGGISTGFFASWLKVLGCAAEFSPRKPKKLEDLDSLAPETYITLERLFARIPEIGDLFQDIFDSPAMWIQPTFDNEGNGYVRVADDVSRTYAILLDESGQLTRQDIALFPEPFSDIQQLPSRGRFRRFRAAVDHPGLPRSKWWDAMHLHRSALSRPVTIMPVFGGVRDYRHQCFVLLYALSIVVRYRPSLWRRIQEGDLDNMRVLIEAFLSVVERVLPEQFLEKITGQRISAHQPGSFWS